MQGRKYRNDIHSLSHSKWCREYHVVFVPKYRRKAFYGTRRLDIGAILRNLYEWKGVNILEAEICIDHVHMLLEQPPKMSVSGFMGFLRGKSSQMIYEKWGNTRFKYGNRSFWCRRYYLDAVGKNTKRIKKYIAKQLKEDQGSEQLAFDIDDPFKCN
ncbi:IS200/IS605 family transposase [Clostridium sporogenes]|uniref:IS200/IS605 family transposase n=1 Tax=Clostridium sp. LCP25S3_F8 TaxID=3438751 RepID=UPI0013D32F06|nr:IS200/IS605 family transposase [Clostridium sporogenes]NFS25386.1 IS200/IS605 family transposase [Clostridium sporogenes]